MAIKAYSAESGTSPLTLTTITRREVGPHDVKISIDYCGVCHSDLHMARNDWGGSVFPVVPGHEVVGRVENVGIDVTGFTKGDLVGVGCLVGSCQSCSSCQENLEQYCEKGSTMTYGSPDLISGGMTYGGYSTDMVVNQKFVLKISKKLDAKAVAPLPCAGITTYSPLQQWNIQKGDKVGIIGLGGLGHMGVKFAAAMGANVVMITRSAWKGEDAKNLGAQEVLLSTDKNAMAAHAGSFDFLLNTIPVGHDVNGYIGLLKRDATMVIVGAIEPLPEVHGAPLIMGRKRMAGSLIGGIKETQEMLDFCAEHNIVSDVEIIKIQDINQAYTRLEKADVKYRFVIDIKSLRES